MPELPEVETTRRGILPWVLGETVHEVLVRQSQLRWRVTPSLSRELTGERIQAIERRAKYLLLRAESGTVILHLGMSGTLRVVDPAVTADRHDHVEFGLSNGVALRLRDPRRFGAVLWTRRDPGRHRLIASLGPEPFDAAFDAAYLYQLSRKRRRALRDFLLDGRVVAGIGNIYANEAAHSAGIHPGRAAGRISQSRYEALVVSVRSILEAAIDAGGTTVRDYANSDGEPGEFARRLCVYGREGADCSRCGKPIQRSQKGGRALFYCSGCQR